MRLQSQDPKYELSYYTVYKMYHIKADFFYVCRIISFVLINIRGKDHGHKYNSS
jgi:hypothetical protein